MAAPELDYPVERSADLERWTALEAEPQGDGAVLRWHDVPLGEESLFLRLGISPAGGIPAP